MARKHVKTHLVRAKKHHDKHQKKLWKLFVKLAKNKNSYIVPKAKGRRKKRGGVLRAAPKPAAAQKVQPKGRRRMGPPPSSQAPPKAKKGGHMVSGQGIVTGQGLRQARVRRKKTTHPCGTGK